MTLTGLNDGTVLIVDDCVDNLTFMAQGLSDDYTVRAAKSGNIALDILRRFDVDLVLLDVVMPEMSGYEVIREMGADPDMNGIPVVFLTAKDSPEDEKLGFELGAVDYIHKPISIPLLRARVRTHIQNKRSKDILRDEKGYLEKEIVKRSNELDLMQDAVVFALASLAETRDPETGDHILRTQYYVKLLSEKLSILSKYKHYLTPKKIDAFFKAAPLHDIGKVGIVDSILLKPGKLTEEEFEIMKTHTILGVRALEKAEQRSGAHNDLITVAKEIAYGHHEKWDGSGYPQGISGVEIPLSARIMAVADVYDALRCKRVYKKSIRHEEAREILLEGKGKHFDPEIIDAFLAQEPKFVEISGEYSE